MKKSRSCRGKEALDGYTAENNQFTLHTTAAGNTGVHAGFTGAFRPRQELLFLFTHTVSARSSRPCSKSARPAKCFFPIRLYLAYAKLIKHFILYRFFNFVTEILFNGLGSMLVRTTVKITAAALAAALPPAKMSSKLVCSSSAARPCRVFRSIGTLGAYGLREASHAMMAIRFDFNFAVLKGLGAPLFPTPHRTIRKEHTDESCSYQGGSMIMISIEQINSMQSADIRAIDKNALVDVQGFLFDNSLSKRERIEQVIESTKNPYCFRYGDLGVHVEFTDDGPTLCELLTNFLLRKKSGL